MSEVIAVCGKGGTGKTTLSALFARLLLERKTLRALIIDADPTGGLSMALSFPVKTTVNELRLEVVDIAKSRKSDARNLAAAIDYRLLESLTEHHNLAFLSVGRPEEAGCYCQVNTFLRHSIEYLAEKFDLTIIDAEAGIEQVNRRVIANIDRLFLVSDLSQKGLRVAETVHRVASASSRFRQAGLILNRVRSEEEFNRIRTDTALPIRGWIPEDETIRRFDASGESYFNLPECPPLCSARRLL